MDEECKIVIKINEMNKKAGRKKFTCSKFFRGMCKQKCKFKYPYCRGE